MAEEAKQNYISLFEAAKLCPYSEAYLRLRARAGKFKSIKIGKKWMTTKAWVDDYVARSQIWNDKITAKRKKENLAEAWVSRADYHRPNIVAYPAVSFELPKIQFSLLAKEPEISIPQSPKNISYSNPQFLFVLGSGVLLALLLFAWMTADFSASAELAASLGRANLSGATQSGVNSQMQAPQDNFEDQLAPEVLENNYSQNVDYQAGAAVEQAQVIAPKLKASLFNRAFEAAASLIKSLR